MSQQAGLLALRDFRGKYLGRLPQRECSAHEVITLEGCHGVRFLKEAPTAGIVHGRPPVGREDPGDPPYLWVIDDSGVPYILDQPVIVLGYSGPKHSNLTGGGQAFVGGELWFKSDQELVVSGASRSEEHTSELQSRQYLVCRLLL